MKQQLTSILAIAGIVVFAGLLVFAAWRAFAPPPGTMDQATIDAHVAAKNAVHVAHYH